MGYKVVNALATKKEHTKETIARVERLGLDSTSLSGDILASPKKLVLKALRGVLL